MPRRRKHRSGPSRPADAPSPTPPPSTTIGSATSKAWTTKDTISHLRASHLKLDDDDIRLDDSLKKIGLVRHHTPKDGACLFRAFAEQTYGTQALHLRARECVVSFLRQHPDDFAPFVCTDGLEYEEYCSAMEQWNAWGGEVEIQAFSRAMRVDIHLYTAGCATPMMIENGQRGPEGTPIRLVYSKGNHYDSAYSISRMSAMEQCQNIVYELLAKAMGRKTKPPPCYKNIELECWIEAVSKLHATDESLAHKLGRGSSTDGEWGGFYYKNSRNDKKKRKKTKAELAEIEEQEKLLEQARRTEEIHHLKAAMKDKESHFPVLGKRGPTPSAIPQSSAWSVKKSWAETAPLSIAQLRVMLFEEMGGLDVGEDELKSIPFGSMCNS